MSFVTNWLATKVHWVRCMKEWRSVSQASKHTKESQWPMHVERLWTHDANNT
jgi:hypothetical protein